MSDTELVGVFVIQCHVETFDLIVNDRITDRARYRFRVTAIRLFYILQAVSYVSVKYFFKIY
jgi:hypothetical protein